MHRLAVRPGRLCLVAVAVLFLMPCAAASPYTPIKLIDRFVQIRRANKILKRVAALKTEFAALALARAALRVEPVIELVERDEGAKGLDSGPTQDQGDEAGQAAA